MQSLSPYNGVGQEPERACEQRVSEGRSPWLVGANVWAWCWREVGETSARKLQKPQRSGQPDCALRVGSGV
jgi:hypothetical protein